MTLADLEPAGHCDTVVKHALAAQWFALGFLMCLLTVVAAISIAFRMGGTSLGWRPPHG